MLRHQKYLAILFCGIALLVGCKYVAQFKENVELQPNSKQFLLIPDNTTFDGMVDSLANTKAIKNITSFIKVAKLKGLPASIKPGRYQLKDGMTNGELVNMLKSGKQSPVQLSFHYLKTLEDLAADVVPQLMLDSISLMRLFKDNAYLQKNFNKDTISIATMLLPNTYELYWDTDAKEFLERMHKEYKKWWTKERINKAKKLGLSRVEVSILASIVQAEQSKHAKEWPIIAGLYLNRLELGMPLQSDPTAVFALKKFNAKRIYYKDLSVKSPYNTYTNIGLPPGPIRIPEIGVLKAVLNPKNHNYIFMCANADLSGYHAFAETYRQHQSNAAAFHSALNKSKIH